MQEHSTGQSTPTATSTADPVLVLQEIRKSYGKTQALISLDLRLRPGAVHGLVGENGAGKSTLVKILSGATAPDGGSIALNGDVCRANLTGCCAKTGYQHGLSGVDADSGPHGGREPVDAGWWRLGSVPRRTHSPRKSRWPAKWGVTSLDMRAKIFRSVSAGSPADRDPVCGGPPAQGADSRRADVVAAAGGHQMAAEFGQVLGGARLGSGFHLAHARRGRGVLRRGICVNGTAPSSRIINSTPLDRGLVVKQMIGRSLDAAFPGEGTGRPESGIRAACPDLRGSRVGPWSQP